MDSKYTYLPMHRHTQCHILVRRLYVDVYVHWEIYIYIYIYDQYHNLKIKEASIAHAHNTFAERLICRHQLCPMQCTLCILDFPQYSVAHYFSRPTYDDFSRRDPNTPYSLLVRATPKRPFM